MKIPNVNLPGLFHPLAEAYDTTAAMHIVRLSYSIHLPSFSGETRGWPSKMIEGNIPLGTISILFEYLPSMYNSCMQLLPQCLGVLSVLRATLVWRAAKTDILAHLTLSLFVAFRAIVDVVEASPDTRPHRSVVLRQSLVRRNRLNGLVVINMSGSINRIHQEAFKKSAGKCHWQTHGHVLLTCSLTTFAYFIPQTLAGAQDLLAFVA